MKQCAKSKGSKLRQSWGSILGKGGCSGWGSQTCSPPSEAEAESFGVGEDHASHQASKIYRGWYQYASVHGQAQHSGSALRNKIPVVQARYSKGVVVQGGTHGGLTDTRWGQSLGSVLRNKIPEALRNKIPVIQARYPQGVIVQGGAHEHIAGIRCTGLRENLLLPRGFRART